MNTDEINALVYRHHSMKSEPKELDSNPHYGEPGYDKPHYDERTFREKLEEEFREQEEYRKRNNRLKEDK